MSQTESPAWELAAFIKIARKGAICFLENSDGSYLMQKNPEGERYVGKLRPPGGGVERQDKDIHQTILRELKEEFNLSKTIAKKKLKFLGFEPRKEFYGTAVFSLKSHGLKPGIYTASNDPEEKVELVKVDLDHPDYHGPKPHKLLSEAAKVIGEKLHKQADDTGGTNSEKVCDRCGTAFTTSRPQDPMHTLCDKCQREAGSPKDGAGQFTDDPSELPRNLFANAAKLAATAGAADTGDDSGKVAGNDYGGDAKVSDIVKPVSPDNRPTEPPKRTIDWGKRLQQMYIRRGLIQETKEAAPKLGCLMAMIPALDADLPNWSAENVPEDTLTYEKIETEPHCTVLYGFNLDFDSDRLAAVIAGTGPLKLTLGKLSCFECPDYDVLKFSVDCPELKALNQKLHAEFSRDITKPKYSYNPHVTLAYVKKGSNKDLPDCPLSGQTFTVNQLLFSFPEKKGRRVFDLEAAEKSARFVTEAELLALGSKDKSEYDGHLRDASFAARTDGHGKVLGSCGHVVAQCRCNHGSDIVPKTLTVPCAACWSEKDTNISDNTTPDAVTKTVQSLLPSGVEKKASTLVPNASPSIEPTLAPNPYPDIPTTGPEAIAYALNNLDLDHEEKEARSVVQRGLKTRRPAAVRKLGIIQGFKRSGIKPGDLMLKRIPVIPPQFRPYSVAGDTFVPGDANELYRDLINMVGVHKELETKLGPEGAASNKLRIYDAARAVYGFGEPTAPKTKERGVSGFLTKVTGVSPKFSFWQRSLTSRTQDFVGRGVIGVDPDLGLDEIGIPESMAWKLYAPYIQRRLVRNGMSQPDAVKAVADKHPHARKMMEVEAKERPVMYSRAPSWHKFNVIGGYPKIIPGNTIMINSFTGTGLNADHDGDNVNVHLPSMHEAVEDVKNKLMPSKMLFSVKNRHDVLPVLKHESLWGGFSAQQRPAKQKHTFPDQAMALAAIKRGDVAMSDEVEIGQPAV